MALGPFALLVSAARLAFLSKYRLSAFFPLISFW